MDTLVSFETAAFLEVIAAARPPKSGGTPFHEVARTFSRLIHTHACGQRRCSPATDLQAFSSLSQQGQWS
jgi:hypothetical protein